MQANLSDGEFPQELTFVERRDYENANGSRGRAGQIRKKTDKREKNGNRKDLRSTISEGKCECVCGGGGRHVPRPAFGK